MAEAATIAHINKDLNTKDANIAPNLNNTNCPVLACPGRFFFYRRSSCCCSF